MESEDTTEETLEQVVEEELESPVELNEEETDDDASIDLQAELDKANAKADENWEKVLLAKAEVDNIRRRTQKDVENAHRFGVEKFAKDLLAVVDSFEMGLAAEGDVAAIKEGMELTYKQLMSALEKAKLEQLNPTGESFDPEQHQAMTMVPSEEHPHNTVMEVFQKGYSLQGRLLRPAMVVVSQSNTPEQTNKIDEQA